MFAKRDQDGIVSVDYWRTMLFQSSVPGEEWPANVKQWFNHVMRIVKGAMERLDRNGKLNELAKWTWFAKRFKEAIKELPPEAIKSIGVSVDQIPWE
jgi:hypothetical protein